MNERVCAKRCLSGPLGRASLGQVCWHLVSKPPGDVSVRALALSCVSATPITILSVWCCHSCFSCCLPFLSIAGNDGPTLLPALLLLHLPAIERRQRLPAIISLGHSLGKHPFALVTFGKSQCGKRLAPKVVQTDACRKAPRADEHTDFSRTYTHPVCYCIAHAHAGMVVACTQPHRSADARAHTHTPFCTSHQQAVKVSHPLCSHARAVVQIFRLAMELD